MRFVTRETEKNIVDVRAAVRGNCRIPIRDIPEDMEIINCLVQFIITEDFGITCESAESVAKLFSVVKNIFFKL